MTDRMLTWQALPQICTGLASGLLAQLPPFRQVLAQLL